MASDLDVLAKRFLAEALFFGKTRLQESTVQSVKDQLAPAIRQMHEHELDAFEEYKKRSDSKTNSIGALFPVRLVFTDGRYFAIQWVEVYTANGNPKMYVPTFTYDMHEHRLVRNQKGLIQRLEQKKYSFGDAMRQMRKEGYPIAQMSSKPESAKVFSVADMDLLLRERQTQNNNGLLTGLVNVYRPVDWHGYKAAVHQYLAAKTQSRLRASA